MKERKDPLATFIRENRSAFDDLKAPPRVWHRINSSTGTGVHYLWKWTAVAAGALLLITVGYIFGLNTYSPQDIAGWEDYQETERYYQVRIDQKIEQLKILPAGDEVLSDLEALDEVYQQLKKQLMKDPNADTQLLLSTMIRHQQQKLKMMEKILDRADKYNTHENENREM